MIKIDKRHINGKRICHLNNACSGNGKRRLYFSYHSNSCKEDKAFNQKHESYPFKLRLIKLSWLDKYKTRKNFATSKRYILGKRVHKVKKHSYIYFNILYFSYNYFFGASKISDFRTFCVLSIIKLAEGLEILSS